MTTEPRWRVGRKVGRTLYLDGVLVGMVDSPELASNIVEAMNGATAAPVACPHCGLRPSICMCHDEITDGAG